MDESDGCLRTAEQVRSFAEAFAGVGLRPCVPAGAYGLAEHVVGLGYFSPNVAGEPLASLPDDLLVACGTEELCARHGFKVTGRAAEHRAPVETS